jgi:hypothetical protein
MRQNEKANGDKMEVRDDCGVGLNQEQIQVKQPYHKTGDPLMTQVCMVIATWMKR